MSQFTKEARKLIPFDGISVNVIDHEKDIIKFSYISGIEVKGRMRRDSLPLGRSKRRGRTNAFWRNR